MTKKEWIPYVLACALLLLGSYYDYTITDRLYGSLPSVGIFFERLILVPIQGVIIWTFCLLYVEKKQLWKLLCAFIASMYAVIDAMHYWFTMDIALCVAAVLVSIVLLCSMLAVLKHLSIAWIQKHRSFFLFFTCVLLSSMLITTLLKSVWGRIRYRDLHSMAEFCVWYKPCGRISNYSFPSGHTAAISVILCFLQWKHNPYERVSLLRYVLVAGGIALMAISRMMMGAHFLSDTIAGFLITYTLYLIWKYHFRKRGIL